MDYYIMPGGEAHCENEFPESLSFFFEQVGGYDDYAEVSQVSQILRIDLSVFQEISYDEDEQYYSPNEEDEEVEDSEDSPAIWHDTDKVIILINSLLDKIAAFPDYYKQVIHGPARQQDAGLSLQITPTKLLPGYPPDYGYLSKGEIVEDLKTLRKTLTCYEENGVRKFKLMYM
ncbi:MAG TPA: hypothetical protein VFO93_17760 [Hymenobacter sp.]|uniref:hypothetical protein n=1 Tax=Hymenobacter sp. TaxID=1898978 RepID=UPI002D80FC30|nr:hypothetical protein [Hymenobacter sp.]HET9505395.1 hypothetical protein [Hymenobacter sp.]